MKYISMLCLTLCPVIALGQVDMGGGFTSMDVRADHAKGNYVSGRFDSLTGAVRITLKGEEPAGESMVIEADQMDFTYTDEAVSTPVKIVLTGNVHIPNPDPNVRSVRSQSAVWSFATGVVTFKDDVRLVMGSGESMTCTVAKIDLATGSFESSGFEVVNFSLGGAKRPDARVSDPSLLGPGDVKDWTPLVAAIKAGLAGDAPSPGKRIGGLLNEQLRAFVENMPVDRIVENGDTLRKELNKLLANPDLYDGAAWQGVTLPEEAKTLAAMSVRDASQTTRLNRLLIEAAWPAAFAGSQ